MIMRDSSKIERGDFQNGELKQDAGVGGYFNKIKNVLFHRNQDSRKDDDAEIKDTGSASTPITIDDVEITDILSTDFEVSDKRRRLSIQGHAPMESIPRSLSSSTQQYLARRGSNCSYSTLRSNFNTNEEEIHNDLERRRSIIQGGGIDGFGSGSGNGNGNGNGSGSGSRNRRDESPCLNLPCVRMTSQDGGSELLGKDSYLQTDDEVSRNGWIIPDYKRTTFGKIDPLERNRVIYLKRSMEVLEKAKKRTKYMINPNETTSEPSDDKKRVNSGTQTHDLEYLKSSLHFKQNRKRKIEEKELSSSSLLSQPTKRQKKRGFYMKDFLYDVSSQRQEKEKEKPEQEDTDTIGYANEISKPRFTTKAEKDGSITKLRPQEDDDGGHDDRGISGISGVGLFGKKQNKDKPFVSEKLNLSLDADYVQKMRSVADIVKLKDKVEDAEPNKSTAVPSSSFKFSIDNEKLEKILTKNNEENIATRDAAAERQKSEQKQEQKELEKANEKNGFTLKFGQPEISKSKINSNKAATPFSFGSKVSTSNGSLDFGSSNNNRKTGTSPSFNFGKVQPEEFNTNKSSQNEKQQVTAAPSPAPAPAAAKPTVPFVFRPIVGDSHIPKDGDKSKAESSVVAEKPVEKSVPSFGEKASSGGGGGSGSSGTFTFGLGKTSDTKPGVDSNTQISILGDESQKQLNKPISFFGASSNSVRKENDVATFGGSKQGQTTSNMFNFGKTKEDNNKSQQPSTLFTFDKKVNQEKNESNNPVSSNFTFSFGGNNKPSSEKEEKEASSMLEKDAGEKDASKSTSISALGQPSTQIVTESKESESSSKPQFSFGTASKTTEKDATAQPFAFGLSSVKPSVGDTKTPTFNFGSATKTSSDKELNGKTVFDGEKAPVFGSSKTSGSFEFASGTNPTSAKSSSSSAAAPMTTPFVFGAKPQSFSSFQSPQIPKPAFGNVFTNKPIENNTSSNVPLFGNSSNGPSVAQPAAAAAAAGGGGTVPAVPSFNFGGSKESTPDPSTIFGKHAHVSREVTPFGGFGVTQQQQTPSQNIFGQIPPTQQQQQPQQQQPSSIFGSTPSAPFSFGSVASPGNISMGNIPSVGLQPVQAQVNPRRMKIPKTRRR